MASNVKKSLGLRHLFHYNRTNIQAINAKRHSTQNRSNNIGYCIKLVKDKDYENYLCTLLYPDSTQGTAFAIRALNIELMQIRDIVSEKAIGLMRLEFWRNSIHDIYEGSIPKSPIAQSIAKAIERHNLSKHWFNRLIDGRELNLQDRAFQSMKEVEDYAENTNSSISYLMLESLGVKDMTADHVASHLGKAQGLITLVRGIPINAQAGRCLLPTELMIHHNLSQEDVLRGCREQTMKDVVYDITSNAHIHLQKAQSHQKDLPKKSAKVFLQAACVSSYLKNIQKADFDIFSPTAQKKDSLIALRIAMQNFRGTF